MNTRKSKALPTATGVPDHGEAVRICGADYSPCESVQDGGHWGIKTPEKIFWVFPVCNEHGGIIQSLPPYLPTVIRPVTTVPPDLTREHPETVRKFFSVRHDYFARTTSIAKYRADNPSLRVLPSNAQFQKGRKRILCEALADFARDHDLISMVWDQHGTQKIANHHGFMGTVWDKEILKGKTERQFSNQMSIAMTLAYALRSARSIDHGQAWAIVKLLKYVMIYEGVPASQYIYLDAMKEAPQPPPKPEIVPELVAELKAGAGAVLRWTVALAEVQKEVRETRGDVAKLVGKQQKKTRKWHQDGGRATSKWKGHEQEAAKLARVMRRAKKNFERDKRTARGALKWARGRGRAWWKSSDGFKGSRLEHFLEEKKISDANLNRLLRKDFRRNPKSKN